MWPFRRHKVNDKKIAVGEKLVEDIRAAVGVSTPRKIKWVYDARSELARINKEEAERLRKDC